MEGKKYCYRLYTEDIENNRFLPSRIADLVLAYGFNSFTLNKAVGYWLGTKELSLCIEIIAESKDRSATKALANAIRMHLVQSAVYWVAWPIDAELIEEGVSR